MVDPSICLERVTETAARTMVWFGAKSQVVSSAQREQLRQLVTVLGTCPSARVEIGGHADDTADAAGNAQLSFQRAQAVAKLFGQAGIQPNQMTAVAYGASRPLGSGKKAADPAVNRRVDFIVR
jgi:OmpA-OmpF porin, OOP family